MIPLYPFPFVSNLSLNLLVTARYQNDSDPLMARVKIPIGFGIPRFLRVGNQSDFVTRGRRREQPRPAVSLMLIESYELFRVMCNANTERDEDEADDLLALIESELRDRRFAPIVRLEVLTGTNSVHRGSPLSPRGAAPDRVHRLCAADRIVARGDRRGTGETSRGPHACAPGLGAHFRRLDQADRSEDRRASAPEGGPHAVHRLRMPVDRQMRIRQPGRSRRPSRPRAAVLAGVSASEIDRGHATDWFCPNGPNPDNGLAWMSQLHSRDVGARSLTNRTQAAANGELALLPEANWDLLPNTKVRRPNDSDPFGWSYTYTGFSLDFARAALLELGARPGCVVLDPFVGSGTTIAAAGLIGVPSVGVDISPFSALLSRTRVASSADLHRVFSLLNVKPTDSVRSRGLASSSRRTNCMCRPSSRT